jgi:hypothetical protein
MGTLTTRTRERTRAPTGQLRATPLRPAVCESGSSPRRQRGTAGSSCEPRDESTTLAGELASARHQLMPTHGQAAAARAQLRTALGELAAARANPQNGKAAPCGATMTAEC